MAPTSLTPLKHPPDDGTGLGPIRVPVAAEQPWCSGARGGSRALVRPVGTRVDPGLPGL